LARYLKHAEHHYFKAINKAFGGYTRATVIKGFNADDSAAILRSKWDRFDDPVAIGLDATKFDMHVSVEALNYEHSFYKSLFPGNKKLVKLLNWQLRNKGIAYCKDGRVKFDMEGTRSSGDMNTSLGNCILMCAMIWALAKELSVTLELSNNGDDCVVFMERKNTYVFRNAVNKWFRRHGFAMTVEDTVMEFEQIEFCQTHPVQLSTGWRMVRNQTAVLQKDPMCLLSVPNSKVYRKWLHAVGTCGSVLSSGVPVQSEVYSVFLRHGVESGKLIDEVYRNRAQLSLARGLAAGEIDARARCSYYFAFGVLPDYQIAMEAYFKSLTLSVEITDPISRDMLDVTTGSNTITFTQESYQ